MASETPKLVIVEEEEVLADITAFRLELLGYTHGFQLRNRRTGMGKYQD